MVKKVNTCIFISGRGSNLLSIIKNSRDYNFPVVVKLIISNNKNAYGLNYAKKYARGLPLSTFVRASSTTALLQTKD